MNLQKVANVVRGLSADGVEKANSGHPGLPLGCAEIGSVLYFDVMNHNPNDPCWPNRDRFVLSGGHGSMLLYSLLHLSGYQLSLTDLQNFRQLGSNTPGHPEYGHPGGVETTTGPLGQGIGNGVGMALAERMLAARFNKPEYPIVDHYTYVLAGDGDMMEGVSGEASSLAGHLGLGKLILIYDSNNITIEGNTEIAFTESVSNRYQAYGWHVQEIDGHSIEQIQEAITKAKQVGDKPSLIVAKTQIAKGAPTKVNTAAAHGAPLGKEEIKGLKDALGLPQEDFHVPAEFADLRDSIKQKGAKSQQQWSKLFAAWSEKNPELATLWNKGFSGELDFDTDEISQMFKEGDKVATRAASGKVINALAQKIPNFIGGSADLAPSTKTYMEGLGSITRDDFDKRNFNFGVREHGMASITNGISLYGYFRPFAATFLVFSDYLRPTLRLSALMKQPVIYVFTHDSIFVGEDGPTHQPIEQTESLRLIPNLNVYRPADGEETAHAWLAALKRTDGPSALILTRQGLPVMPKAKREELKRGGYVLKEATNQHQLTLVAAGSEVSLVLEAADLLEGEGIGTRVVSILCREEFMQQDATYRETVIPGKIPVLAVELGVGSGWYSISPDAKMRVMSLDRYGMSGPGEKVAEELGFIPKNVVTEAKKLFS